MAIGAVERGKRCERAFVDTPGILWLCREKSVDDLLVLLIEDATGRVDERATWYHVARGLIEQRALQGRELGDIVRRKVPANLGMTAHGAVPEHGASSSTAS